MMKIQNENYQQQIQEIFSNSNFIKDVGIQYKDCGPGWCESTLAISGRHNQQSNIVHAGVLSTMLDNTAGAAAFSLMPAGVSPISVEFKVNLLRPATGNTLYCKAQVLKPGAKFSVVESEVFYLDDGKEKLAAKATVTLVGL